MTANLALYCLMALPFVYLACTLFGKWLDNRWRRNVDTQHRERVGLNPKPFGDDYMRSWPK